MAARRPCGSRCPPGSMTSIDPYGVGADSISARKACHCRRRPRATNSRPYTCNKARMQFFDSTEPPHLKGDSSYVNLRRGRQKERSRPKATPKGECSDAGGNETDPVFFELTY